MPVVAVINRKGGSGKSTLATQLAGYFAQSGLKVMLGDVDRQQSSLAWLRRRARHPVARTAEILPWALDTRNARRPPPGVTHVVLDTPGGLHGLELARVVMHADLILVPVSPSAFDRESAAESLAELMRLPRVASGRCRLAVMGMRMDARSRDIARLTQWASTHQVSCLGALRDSRVYPRTAEQGLSLFDLPAEQLRTDLAQWQRLLSWVDSSAPPPHRVPGAQEAEALMSLTAGAPAQQAPDAEASPPTGPAASTAATAPVAALHSARPAAGAAPGAGLRTAPRVPPLLPDPPRSLPPGRSGAPWASAGLGAALRPATVAPHASPQRLLTPLPPLSRRPHLPSHKDGASPPTAANAPLAAGLGHSLGRFFTALRSAA